MAVGQMLGRLRAHVHGCCADVVCGCYTSVVLVCTCVAPEHAECGHEAKVEWMGRSLFGKVSNVETMISKIGSLSESDCHFFLQRLGFPPLVKRFASQIFSFSFKATTNKMWIVMG